MTGVGSGVRSKALLSLVGSLLVVSVAGRGGRAGATAPAATVTFGTIQAQMANHLGVNDGTDGNCIRYSPAPHNAQLVDSSASSRRSTDRRRRARQLLPRDTEHQRHRARSGSGPSRATTVQDGAAVPHRADGPLQQPDLGQRPVFRRHAEHRPERLHGPTRSLRLDARRDAELGSATAATTRSTSPTRSPTPP